MSGSSAASLKPQPWRSMWLWIRKPKPAASRALESVEPDKTTFNWNGVAVEGTLGGFAYWDLVVRGGTLASAVANPLVPTDQGKIFGMGTGKLDFLWGHGLSTFAEADVRGRDHVFGATGKVGLTYVFQGR